MGRGKREAGMQDAHAPFACRYWEVGVQHLSEELA